MWQRRLAGVEFLAFVRVHVQVLVVDILGLRRGIDKFFVFVAYYDILLLRCASRHLQCWGRAAARR